MTTDRVLDRDDFRAVVAVLPASELQPLAWLAADIVRLTLDRRLAVKTLTGEARAAIRDSIRDLELVFNKLDEKEAN